MTLARRLLCFVCAAFIFTIAFPCAGFSGDETWITIERGVARRAQAGLAAAGRPGELVILGAGSSEALSIRARSADVVVASLTRRAFDILPEILHAQLPGHGPRFLWHATREAAEQEATRANSRLLLRTPEPPIPYTIDNGPVVQALIAPMQEVNVRNTILSLGAFFTRHRNCPTGLDSAVWIHDTWQSLAAGRPDVTVEYYNHSSTPQPSVILTIPGTTLPSEVVVLGGHRDSTAGSNCTLNRSPGEDDDASGIANLTEVLRVAMALGYRPLRTVKLMAYAGEEGGLLGSQEIAADYANHGINVVGVIQFDMTAYRGSPQDIFIFNDTFTSSAQNTFIGNLVAVYLPTLTRGTSACGYACSDHASWGQRGYPASLPFEASFTLSNPWIHSANDTLAQCCGGLADHSLKFTKLAGAYLAETAKGCIPAVNQAPVANAGTDHQTSPLMTLLDGRLSSDPDAWPAPLMYSWTQVSGPPVTLLDAQSAVARFRAPYLRATYVFRLTVSDGCQTATDDVTIVPRTEP